MKRYKVLRDGTNWSLGYPSEGAAEAAARRLNAGSPSPAPLFTSKEMSPVDYRLIASLEAA